MQVNINNVSLKQYKTSLKLNQQQKNIIIGTLLGDSSLLKSQAKDPLFTLKFEQKIASEDYVFFFCIKFLVIGVVPRRRNAVLKKAFLSANQFGLKHTGIFLLSFMQISFIYLMKSLGSEKR